jgi:hypothetical protein
MRPRKKYGQVCVNLVQLHARVVSMVQMIVTLVILKVSSRFTRFKKKVQESAKRHVILAMPSL